MPSDDAVHAGPMRARWPLSVALGVTQIIGWGSVYYSFGFLLQHYPAALGMSREAVAGAFALALLVSGLLAPGVGGLIDRQGGRLVMAAGSLATALLLAALSVVQGPVGLYACHAGLGAAMACTLYEPAFAVLVRAFGARARRAITLLTLFGGFASTVFWPLTETLIARLGWRDALLALAALNLCVAVPLHALALPGGPARRDAEGARFPFPTAHSAPAADRVARDPVFLMLGGAFAGYALVFSCMSAHLMSMLQAKGLASASAATIGAMVGPMQVLGRVMEFAFARRLSILRVGAAAMVALPLSLLLLRATQSGMAAFGLFALVYGVANGVMTIVQGNVVNELYGPARYGRLSGLLAAPSLAARAAGPLLGAWLVTRTGGADGALLALAGLAALTAALFAAVARRHATASASE